MAKKKFWQFVNQTAESAELLIYGDISDTSWWGDEVTPKQFAEDLKNIGDVKDITVRINSGGGDVFAASTIGNLLETSKATVTAVIDGLCASAATIIACHCNNVKAQKDSIYMIHPVRMGICGYKDATELHQYIDALDAIRDNIINLYAKKTGRCVDDVAAQMDATSWFTPAEAKENGFVDELIGDEENTTVENIGGLLFVNKVGTSLPFNEAPKFVQDSLAAAPAAKSFEDKTAEVPINQKEEDTMEIKTVDELRSAYPDLVGEIEAAAAEQATNAERQRIKDIEEMSLAGSEDFANEAKFEKPISAQDYAMQAIKNAKQSEEQKRANYLNGLKDDAENSGVNSVESEPVVDTDADEFMDAIKSVNKKEE
jgi:ATP-dependent protease ClpP protease subunit